MNDPMKIGVGGVSKAVEQAGEWFGKQPPDSAFLELGTLRSDPNFPTHHKEWNPDAKWILSDVEHGTDVDVACDAHDLSYVFDEDMFDGIVAVSVWEHLARPWIAAESVYTVLKPGGRMYVATHQTFPIHGYPSDYFRFSKEALSLIFLDAGFDVIEADYSYPAQIIPPPEVTRWNPAAPAYLNVDVWLTK